MAADLICIDPGSAPTVEWAGSVTWNATSPLIGSRGSISPGHRVTSTGGVRISMQTPVVRGGARSPT